MHRGSHPAAIFGCFAAFALAGCGIGGNIAPTANSAGLAQLSGVPIGPGWIHAGNLFYRIPHYMATSASVHHATQGVLLNYYGGPLITAPKMYLILWGYKKYHDPDKVAPLLKDYLSVMGGSSHNNVYTQYYRNIDGMTKQIFVGNAKAELGGVWDDETDAVPESPSDLQVAEEALEGVQHFGYDPNGSYIVATPHGHSTLGFGKLWCGYHSYVDQEWVAISYTNLPYVPDAGPNCGANYWKAPKDESSLDEGVTIVEGHEEGESITDPIYALGWYDPGAVKGSNKGEIGDLCAWIDIRNDRFGNKWYSMQPMYSNASESCVHTYP